MAGISRIRIMDAVTGRGGYRFAEAAAMQDAANRLYRSIWARKGLPLAPGDECKECRVSDFAAGYDHALGIDVFFSFENGANMTLQEKFLKTKFQTLTVEYMQDPRNGIQGDWFTMKTQFYFVGYYDDARKEAGFWDYVLVKWPDLRLWPGLRWRELKNRKDGARASFLYLPFDALPADCIVARHPLWCANQLPQPCRSLVYDEDGYMK